MLKKILSISIAAAILGGCASSQMKARKDQREKASQSSKLYCDFVNGELYPDVEVMLNLEMAKRCDSEKAFTVTNYKTSNENMGIVYCCALPNKDGKANAPLLTAPAAKPGDKPADKPASPEATKSGADELAD